MFSSVPGLFREISRFVYKILEISGELPGNFRGTSGQVLRRFLPIARPVRPHVHEGKHMSNGKNLKTKPFGTKQKIQIRPQKISKKRSKSLWNKGFSYISLGFPWFFLGFPWFFLGFPRISNFFRRSHEQGTSLGIQNHVKSG